MLSSLVAGPRTYTDYPVPSPPAHSLFRLSVKTFLFSRFLIDKAVYANDSPRSPIPPLPPNAMVSADGVIKR